MGLCAVNQFEFLPDHTNLILLSIGNVFGVLVRLTFSGVPFGLTPLASSSQAQPVFATLSGLSLPYISRSCSLGASPYHPYPFGVWQQRPEHRPGSHRLSTMDYSNAVSPRSLSKKSEPFGSLPSCTIGRSLHFLVFHGT
jgi:hypothetical protein